ncbi:hypothetical protein WJU16_12505 [Chitinophaga pollutisoli]|uniref:Signal transduction histidine kinase dimerisation/phosphoacceptor domain-containing protein n=1 Tax=Chitinophaga pollutisoli TaxID=3133966 RepID=A0ABZ2YIH6_9BACT
MKSSTGVRDLPADKWLINDVFHELRSMLSAILSSVELIEMYAVKPDSGGRISRQAGSIKLQVMELEFQLQNVKVIQDMLNASQVTHRGHFNIVHMLEQLVADERYTHIFPSRVTFDMNDEREMAFADEQLLRHTVLNVAWCLNRNAAPGAAPEIRFAVQEDHFEMTGVLPAPVHASLDQRMCRLIGYLAELQGGGFELNEQEGLLAVKIPV